MFFKMFRKKFKKIFSFSWSVIFIIVAILLLFFGMHLASKAFQDKEEVGQWNLRDNPDSIDDFLTGNK